MSLYREVAGWMVLVLACVGALDVVLILSPALVRLWRWLPGAGLAWGRRGTAAEVQRWARVSRRGVRLWGVYVGFTFFGVMRTPQEPRPVRAYGPPVDDAEVIA